MPDVGPVTAASPSASRPAWADGPLWPALAVAWAAGALIRLGRAAPGAWRARRALRAAPPAPEELTRRVAELSARLGLRRPPSAYLIPGVMSPALWGLGLRARLLVPADLWARLRPGQRDALIVHELAHLRRGDHLVRLVELAALGAFWWFPVAWWARRALREAEEQCCDAWVVWALPEARRDYAATLLDTLDFLAQARPRLPELACGLGDLGAIRTRLALIVRGRTARALSPPAVLALIAAASALLPLAPPAAAASPAWLLEALTLGDRCGQVHTRAEDLPGGFILTHFGDEPEPRRIPMPLPPAGYHAAWRPDGSLVVAGLMTGPSMGPRTVRLTSLLADGTPDPRFGEGGSIDTGLMFYAPPADGAHVALQPDGRVVLALTVADQTRFSDLLLARFGPDGLPDRTFGDDGSVAINVGRKPGQPDLPSIDTLADLAVLPDGRIVAAATASGDWDDGDNLAVVRLLPDGRPDPSFGVAGRAIVSAPVDRPADASAAGMGAWSADRALTLAPAPDGRIAVAGMTSQVRGGASGPNAWVVAVLDEHGRPDPAFGPGGLRILDLARPRPDGGWVFATAHAAAFLPDGRLLVLGSAPAGTSMRDDATLVRLGKDGSLDASFGERGIVRPGSTPFAVRYSCMALADDGSILLGGSWFPGPEASDLVLARLQPDGRPDPGFGDGGRLWADPTGSREVLTELALSDEGRVAAVGFAAVPGRGTMLIAVRFRPAARPLGLLTATAAGTAFTGLALALMWLRPSGVPRRPGHAPHPPKGGGSTPD
jgi:uncharacterized delta-60 repeat protein